MSALIEVLAWRRISEAVRTETLPPVNMAELTECLRLWNRAGTPSTPARRSARWWARTALRWSSRSVQLDGGRLPVGRDQPADPPPLPVPLDGDQPLPGGQGAQGGGERQEREERAGEVNTIHEVRRQVYYSCRRRYHGAARVRKGAQPLRAGLPCDAPTALGDFSRLVECPG